MKKKILICTSVTYVASSLT